MLGCSPSWSSNSSSGWAPRLDRLRWRMSCHRCGLSRNWRRLSCRRGSLRSLRRTKEVAVRPSHLLQRPRPGSSCRWRLWRSSGSRQRRINTRSDGRLRLGQENVSPASGAALLALEPRAQAVEVENVATLELLGRLVWSALHRCARRRSCRRSRRIRRLRRPVLGSVGDRWGGIRRDHLVSTDDARLVSLTLHLRRRGVGVQGVHVLGGTAVANEVLAAGQEGPAGHPYVSEDVEGQAVVRDDDEEEGEVCEQLEQVCGGSAGAPIRIVMDSP